RAEVMTFISAPGIVHQQVESSLLALYAREYGFHVGINGVITANRNTLAAARFDGFRRVFDSAGQVFSCRFAPHAASGNVNDCTRLSQCECDAAACTAAGSGNNRNFVLHHFKLRKKNGRASSSSRANRSMLESLHIRVIVGTQRQAAALDTGHNSDKTLLAVVAENNGQLFLSDKRCGPQSAPTEETIRTRRWSNTCFGGLGFLICRSLGLFGFRL